MSFLTFFDGVHPFPRQVFSASSRVRKKQGGREVKPGKGRRLGEIIE
jgi:hypothetical protein